MLSLRNAGRINQKSCRFGADPGSIFQAAEPDRKTTAFSRCRADFQRTMMAIEHMLGYCQAKSRAPLLAASCRINPVKPLGQTWNVLPGYPGTGITDDDSEHVGEARIAFRNRDFDVAAAMPDGIVDQVGKNLRQLIRVAQRFESCAFRQPIEQAGLVGFCDRSQGIRDLSYRLPDIAAFFGRQVFVEFNSAQ